MPTLHDFKATSIEGDEIDLASYDGKAVLVVNTASECGFTSQYAGLQELHDAYADRGFAVLGFPCDQFGHQEPGGDAEIASFCERRYGVSFPLFSKVDVHGDDAHPLFGWIESQGDPERAPSIKWNFTKFLFAPDGTLLRRYGSTTEPAAIAPDIESALGH